MRVLIVSGFPSGGAGTRKEDNYVRFIRNAIDRLRAPDVNVRVRKYNELHEFLPSARNTQEENLRCIRSFDRLDMVFIDGDQKRLPWSTWNSQVYVLVKMCFQTGKCLFASSFAMNTLLYLSSTNTQKVKVLNGDGKGGPLSDLEAMDSSDPGCDDGVFLDHATGDAYRFDKKERQWAPVLNVGLFKRTAGKNAPKRHVDTDSRLHKGLYQHPKGYQELSVKVQKKYIQHWLFQNLSESEFRVKYTSDWVPSPMYDHGNPSGGAAINILAAEPLTAQPCILEYGHIVGVAGSIEKEYPETVTILSNYIKHKYSLIVKHDRLEYMTQEQFRRCLDAESFVSVLDPGRTTRRKTASIVPPIKTQDLRDAFAEPAAASVTERKDPVSKPTPRKTTRRNSVSSFSKRETGHTLHAPLPRERSVAEATLKKESLALTARTANQDEANLNGGGGAVSDFMRMLDIDVGTAQNAVSEKLPPKRPTSAMPVTSRGSRGQSRRTSMGGFGNTSGWQTPGASKKTRPMSATPNTRSMEQMTLREAFSTGRSATPSYMRPTASSSARSPGQCSTPRSLTGSERSATPSPPMWSQAHVRKVLNKGKAALQRPATADSQKRRIRQSDRPYSSRRHLRNTSAPVEGNKGILGSGGEFKSEHDKVREEEVISRAKRVGPSWVNPGKATALQRYKDSTPYANYYPAASGPYEPPGNYSFRDKVDKSKFVDQKGFSVCGPSRTATFDSMR